MPSSAVPSPRPFLNSLFEAALDAARPSHCLPQHLPEPPAHGRTIVIGAGKGAAAMAKTVEDNWRGPLEGLVVTRDGHGAPCRIIEVVEASHPVPDQRGREAAQRILDAVRGLSADDLVLCLISGGGSALLTMPGEGLQLDGKQAINRALLRSGVPIDEMNTVRKHLSAIKGGRLAAAAHPARVVTLAISDVPGDDPSIIASGPTVADPSSAADAQAILERYSIDLPAGVEAFLASPAAETPKPGDPRLAGAEYRMIATPRMALEAAAALCERQGVRPVILGDDIEGEARQVGGDLARLALEHAGKGPVALLSGGETTVTVKGNGRGGRNAEFLLALAIALDGAPNIHAVACDTDGIDGSEDNAGAYCGPDSLARATAAGLDARVMLDNNDGYGFFDAIGDLIVTGPTLTNVNDFRAIFIA
jgi:hydroxypyruvate reductase